MLKGLQAVFRSEGLRGLYKGWWPTLLRDVPFSALYWHSFERIRWPLRDALEAYTPPHADGRENSTAALRMADFGAGALGGLVSAVVTHPFDVVKTRKQIGKLPSRMFRRLVSTSSFSLSFSSSLTDHNSPLAHQTMGLRAAGS
jgi:solute carrier family 25 protein 39/40